MSTKKSGCCGNGGVNALGNRSSQLGVRAKLLAQADKQQGSDDAVDLPFHRGPPWPENPVCELPPVSQLSAGRVAPPLFSQEHYRYR